MNKPILYRQIGGHHWKKGVINHLKKTYPRPRTIVASFHTGWVYVIEDKPDFNKNKLLLRTFHINYQNNNIDFESSIFNEQLNSYLNTNPLSVITVTTNTEFNN